MAFGTRIATDEKTITKDSEGRLIINPTLLNALSLFPPSGTNVWFDSCPFSQTYGYVTVSANTITAWHQIISREVKIKKFAFNVYTSTTNHARAAIYKDNGSLYPGSLVWQSSEIDLTNQSQVILDLNLNLKPGIYWLCLLTNGNTDFQCVQDYGICLIPPFLKPYPNYKNNCYTVSYNFGPYPATFPTGGDLTVKYVVIMLQV